MEAEKSELTCMEKQGPQAKGNERKLGRTESSDFSTVDVGQEMAVMQG